MKSLRFVLTAGLISLASSALAQSDMKMSDASMSSSSATAPVESVPVGSVPADTKTDAQQSFAKLKTLAGTWDGHVTANPPQPDIDNKDVHETLRVTSMGNAMMHEMTGAGRPDDPITMIYLDGDRLMLTHYCDAGNRPRMTAGKISPDGKSVEFAFLDIAGSTKYGHMDHAVFTEIDADHHSEDWTYITPKGPMHAHMDLQRTK